MAEENDPWVDLGAKMTAPISKNIAARSVRDLIPRAPGTVQNWISCLSGRYCARIHAGDLTPLGVGCGVALLASTPDDPMIVGRTSLGRTLAHES